MALIIDTIKVSFGNNSQTTPEMCPQSRSIQCCIVNGHLWGFMELTLPACRYIRSNTHNFCWHPVLDRDRFLAIVSLVAEPRMARPIPDPPVQLPKLEAGAEFLMTSIALVNVCGDLARASPLRTAETSPLRHPDTSRSQRYITPLTSTSDNDAIGSHPLPEVLPPLPSLSQSTNLFRSAKQLPRSLGHPRSSDAGLFLGTRGMLDLYGLR